MIAAADEMYGLWNTHIATARLNRWLEGMPGAHPPLVERGFLSAMTQIKTRPPTFALFVSRRRIFRASSLSHHRSSHRFRLWGVPVRMVMRKGDNPYAHKAKRRWPDAPANNKSADQPVWWSAAKNAEITVHGLQGLLLSDRAAPPHPYKGLG